MRAEHDPTKRLIAGDKSSENKTPNVDEEIFGRNAGDFKVFRIEIAPHCSSNRRHFGREWRFRVIACLCVITGCEMRMTHLTVWTGNRRRDSRGIEIARRRTERVDAHRRTRPSCRLADIVSPVETDSYP